MANTEIRTEKASKKYLLAVSLCLILSLVAVIYIWWYYDQQLTTIEQSIENFETNR